MLRNYFRIAIRSLKRNSTYTAINILGLSMGISASIIILLNVHHQFSYEEIHGKRNRIYRVVMDQKDAGGTTYSPSVPYPLAVGLKNDVPGIPAITRIHYSLEEQVEIDGEKFKEHNIIFADSGFFDVFDYPLIIGNAKKTLSQPNQALVTEDFAAKHFEDGQAIGKSFKLGGLIDVQISAILKNAPSNTHLSYNVIISYESFGEEFLHGFDPESWGVNSSGYCYLILPPDYTIKDMNSRLTALTNKYHSKEDAAKNNYYLQPLNEIYFDQRYANEEFKSGNKEYMIIWIGIGIFILIMACINFINLSTALSIKRSKEVGVRKVLGAGRLQLTKQFLGETLLITTIAVLLSLGLVEWISRGFNSYFGMHIKLDLFGQPFQLLLLAAILLFVTLLSGLYPSFILGNFKPIEVLKSKLSGSGSAGGSISVRQGLVIFQFIMTQVLITGTIIISQQLNYFGNKPLGFNSDALITLPVFSQDTILLEKLKNRLLVNKNIENVSFAIGVPTSKNNLWTTFKINTDDGEIKGDIALKPADRDYLKTFDLKMKTGNWFKSEKPFSDSREFVINETAAKLMGFSNPEDALGKYFSLSLKGSKAPIIGVIKDFHMESLHKKIEPAAILQMPNLYYEVGVKVNNANIKASIEFLREQWTNAFPDYFFEYSFLDEHLQGLYEEEQKTLTLFRLFSGISILIGCMGLFGLISFIIYQRTKEIGIRKVLGASISQLLYLLSKEFLILVSIAFTIACPIAWYFMTDWLSNFAYKTDLSWWFFIVSFGITLLIALATISFRSIKAALTNPITSLRDD